MPRTAARAASAPEATLPDPALGMQNATSEGSWDLRPCGPFEGLSELDRALEQGLAPIPRLGQGLYLRYRSDFEIYLGSESQTAGPRV